MAVEEFLAVEKIARGRFRWSDKGRPDYVEAGSGLDVPHRLDLHGRLILTAHKVRVPNKYSFSIIFRERRVLALDVEPGHSHYNQSTLTSVKGTHWQYWPSMEAVPDSRDFNWTQWLDAFLKAGNIRLAYPRRGPPFGEQLGLDYD